MKCVNATIVELKQCHLLWAQEENEKYFKTSQIKESDFKEWLRS